MKKINLKIPPYRKINKFISEFFIFLNKRREYGK